MSAIEPKKAHVLSAEHKAKMAAGRTAAAAKRAAEKPMPTEAEAKEARLAAAKARRELEKAADNKKKAERREVKTKAVMIEAAAPLAYYKKVLSAVEAIEGVKRDEVLAYFNDKIEDLEADVAGKARYAYVLGVGDIHNGDTDWNYTKTFKTSQQVSAHVAQTVSNWMEREGDNDDDLNEPFPTAESIDARLGDAESIDARLGDAEYSSEIQLFAYGDPYVSCLSFTLSRNRLN